MYGLGQDIKAAWRAAISKPATALLIIVTLALGIGANSAMFSMAWHVLLAPLPYADGERLVKLEQHSPDSGLEDGYWSLPTLLDYESQSETLDELFGYTQFPLTLVGQNEPASVRAGVVSANFFSALGITPVLGRPFLARDDREEAIPVLLLSHDFWVAKFAADSNVVGKSLELNGLLVEVIGVLPDMPDFPGDNHIWITHSGNPYDVLLSQNQRTNRRGSWFDDVYGKVRMGESRDSAQAEAITIARRLATAFPDSYPQGYSVDLTYLKDEMVGDSGSTVLLLLGLAFLVVLIACANVANLNLTRVVRRRQELAVREAMGADPGRIRRQLFTESVLLALIGGVVGLALAYPALHLLTGFVAQYTPLASEIRMDATILLFTMGIALLLGLLSGITGMFHQRDINRSLKEGGDRVSTSLSGMRRRRMLLTLQFTVSFIVLSTAALILLSLYRLSSQALGYEAENVLALHVPVNVDLTEDPQQFPRQVRSFGLALLNGIEALPAVEATGLFSGRPLLQDSYYMPPDESFTLEGFPEVTAKGALHMATEGFFLATGIPLLRGRLFTPADDEGTPKTAIVNANFAQAYFSAGDAVGQRIKLPWKEEWWTIVGVVGNIRSTTLHAMEGASVYYNYRQFPGDVLNAYVKSDSDPQELKSSIAGIVRNIDARQAISSMVTLGDIKSTTLAPERLRTLLIVLFGVLALAITLSGVIGVLTYDISQRMREIGMRMAIGANPYHIKTMFVKDVLKLFVGGLSLGLVLMLASAPMLQPLLFQTGAINVMVYLASGGLLALAVLIATYLPASKAGRMNPVTALHFE